MTHPGNLRSMLGGKQRGEVEGSSCGWKGKGDPRDAEGSHAWLNGMMQCFVALPAAMMARRSCLLSDCVLPLLVMQINYAQAN